MEEQTFEEINAAMDSPHILHYVSSVKGCLSAGEAVFLDEEFTLQDGLKSKVAMILRKQDLGFLVNFYLLPTSNAIPVPRMMAPRKRTYIGYPSQELLQSTYVGVVVEERVVGMAYLIGEADILSGRKAFGVGMVDCFFRRHRVNADLSIGPFDGPLAQMAASTNCRSLTEQTWSVRRKIHRVLTEALNSCSLTSTRRRHKTLDFLNGSGSTSLANSTTNRQLKMVL